MTMHAKQEEEYKEVTTIGKRQSIRAYKQLDKQSDKQASKGNEKLTPILRLIIMY